MRIIISLFALLLLAGCGESTSTAVQKRAAEEGREAEQQPRGTVRREVDEVVEGMTGIKSVRTGEAMKEKINKIQEQQQRQLEELEDM
jgi:hypothetical protein